jgi:benzodiazapine receptor
MKTKFQYADYRKPSWAPPSWLFAPVWAILYCIIAVSYGYAVYAYFVLFNAAYTPIQFRIRNYALASVDILLVFATLVWALISIYPFAAWVSYVNAPYLAWVTFATILQLTITYMNRATFFNGIQTPRDKKPRSE